MLLRLVVAVMVLAAPGARAATQETTASPAPAEAAPQGSPAAVADTAAETPRRGILGRLRGAVFGPGKKPLPGLLVELSSSDQAGLLRITSTNEKGEYSFPDLPAGTYEIEVGSSRYGRQRKRNVAVRPPFRNIVDFDLVPREGPPASPRGATGPSAATAPAAPVTPGAPPVTVRGSFMDQGRRPVAEVSVTFVALDGRGIHQTFSEADGSFALDGIPPGRYRVVVSSPGHVGLDLKDIAVPAGTGLKLKLSLVDYPLNFQGRGDEDLPREEPRPAPTPAAPAPTPRTQPG